MDPPTWERLKIHKADPEKETMPAKNHNLTETS